MGDPAAVDFTAGDLCGVLIPVPGDRRPGGRPRSAGRRARRRRWWWRRSTCWRSHAGRRAGRRRHARSGSAQHFGVPMGFGGPHAAFLATRDEYKRRLPGRIIGVATAAADRPAHGDADPRAAHPPREGDQQHLHHECCSPSPASLYAVYHGPEELKAIARRVHALAAALERGCATSATPSAREPFFDTLRVGAGERTADDLVAAAGLGINLHRLGERAVGIALDGRPRRRRRAGCWSSEGEGLGLSARTLAAGADLGFAAPHARQSRRSKPIRSSTPSPSTRCCSSSGWRRDLSLATSMIPLGSCTVESSTPPPRWYRSPGPRSAVFTRSRRPARPWIPGALQVNKILARRSPASPPAPPANAGSQSTPA